MILCCDESNRYNVLTTGTDGKRTKPETIKLSEQNYGATFQPSWNMEQDVMAEQAEWEADKDREAGNGMKVMSKA